MNFNSKIYVAGHNGMVGSAIIRHLNSLGYNNIIVREKRDLDLKNQSSVKKFFGTNSIEYAIIAAAKVGGIHANNQYPADFIYDNLAIAQNTIHQAYCSGVKRLIFLGSTCIYPKLAVQPLKESSLLSSELEPTNEAYAIAKIAGLKLCQFYRKQYGCMFHSIMPTNLYGKGDNYHHENSHVMPALIRRFHEARENDIKEVVVWGSGNPLREFLHADDAAAGIVHMLSVGDPPDLINLGSGVEISIKDLAFLIAKVTGYLGNIVFDKSKPDGTPRKVTDISLIKNTGWKPKIDLEKGVSMAYKDFLIEIKEGRLRV